MIWENSFIFLCLITCTHTSYYSDDVVITDNYAYVTLGYSHPIEEVTTLHQSYSLQPITQEISMLQNDTAKLGGACLLIRQLLESLEEENEDENAEEFWIDEAKRRYNDYKQGKISEKPAKQVLEHAKSNLK